MTRPALIALILTLATGCDKAKELAGGGARAQAAEPAPGERLDLAKRPDVLFQVFGERTDAKIIPIAALDGGTLKPIVLSASGWRQFDAIYMHSGTTYPLYRDGRAESTIEVKQGMWEGEPLYALPNCETLTPLAAVALNPRTKVGFTVEFLASTAQLGATHAGRTPSAAEVARLGRQVGAAVAAAGGVPPDALGLLDFASWAVNTGATAGPTIVVSYTDPRGQEAAASGGNTTHVFAIADRATDGSYVPTYTHVVNGPAAAAEQRRYVDHLDLTGDGIDEIVLEHTQYGGDTYLEVLGYQGGAWRVVYRTRSSWCLDGN
jgi:hypothetical protein